MRQIIQDTSWDFAHAAKLAVDDNRPTVGYPILGGPMLEALGLSTLDTLAVFSARYNVYLKGSHSTSVI